MRGRDNSDSCFFRLDLRSEPLAGKAYGLGG